ncbi:unnamed protein product [Brugia timori]|uniref:Uncharacterized protein n=1 Tax=Brugia timori TaxID=42155 RepID=A0A0R3QKM6_9BILA|nr:unnamed protein product [Brugia timori]
MYFDTRRGNPCGIWLMLKSSSNKCGAPITAYYLNVIFCDPCT